MSFREWYLMKRMLLETLGLAVLLVASLAAAQCTAKTDAFTGSLKITETDGDGFPVQLGMPEDLEDLPFVLLSCEEGTELMVSITKPVRAKDGGPALAGPLRSYFYYGGKVYDPEKTLKLKGSFEDLAIPVRLTLNDGENVLLASDDYQYSASLIITTTVSEPELGAEAVDLDKFLLSLESKLLDSQSQE